MLLVLLKYIVATVKKNSMPMAKYRQVIPENSIDITLYFEKK